MSRCILSQVLMTRVINLLPEPTITVETLCLILYAADVFSNTSGLSCYFNFELSSHERGEEESSTIQKLLFQNSRMKAIMVIIEKKVRGFYAFYY